MRNSLGTVQLEKAYIHKAKLKEQSEAQFQIRALKTFVGGFAWPTILLLISAWILYLGGLYAYASQLIGPVSLLICSSIAIYLVFTPLHEGAHGNIEGKSKAAWLSSMIASLAGLMFLSPMRAFRFLHLTHHQNTNDAAHDPDYWVKGTSLPVVLLRCLMIYPAYIYFYLFKKDGRTDKILILDMIYLLAGWSLLLAGLFTELSGLVLWGMILPIFLGTAIQSFLFDWLPHHPHSERHPLYTSRNFPGRLLNILLLGQNVHLVHHLNPRIPFYRYQKAYFACGLHHIPAKTASLQSEKEENRSPDP